MKETRQIMGMPVVIEIAEKENPHLQESLEKAFAYFEYVDATFSTYKNDSEVSKINRGELQPTEYSNDMKTIFALAEETKKNTHDYFDIHTPTGLIDPSGIVKGWAINNTAALLRSLGHRDFYVEAGGDIQTTGKNSEGREWRIGIRNPFKYGEIVKVVFPDGKGVATSGIAIRGKHIYNPHTKQAVETDLVSLTVIGPDIYEADRFVTAAFAMGRDGLVFIENLGGFEGYAIDTQSIATMTSGFKKYMSDKNNIHENN